MSYTTELLKKNYQGNVVVQIFGEYFAIRQPDTGLTVDTAHSVVKALRINPTTVDLRRVNTTVGQYSFNIVDKDNQFTLLLSNNTQITGTEVRIWIGRNTAAIDGVDFDFADYFELPLTLVKKIEHNDNSYTVTTAEQTDRMARPAFNTQIILGAAMLDSSTVIQASGDISAFRTSGLLKIDKELMTYTSINTSLNRFNGLTRGMYGTTPVAHDRGATIYEAYKVEENPIDIFLKFLISDGGGGTYDVYPEGLGIDENLIDVAGLEELRDSIFLDEEFRLFLFNIPNSLKYIEDNLLYPNNLRIAISSDSKITLALLDQSVFGSSVPVIDEDSIIEYPKWTVDDNSIINQITYDWDWDEGTNQYNQHVVYKDQDSIDRFGLRQPLVIQAKGIQEDLNGAEMVEGRAFRLLLRFANPNPQITIATHINNSLINIGDKVFVDSSQIPTSVGTLDFGQELEVLSRSIDQLDGKVQFQLAFTSYSGFRACYIAPSDNITGVTDQKTINIATGRGVQYKPGWVMRLFDNSTRDYTSDPPNVIASIVGNQITFVDDFATTLVSTAYRIVFALYDEVDPDQQRYGFISPYPSETFPDGTSAYLISF